MRKKTIDYSNNLNHNFPKLADDEFSIELKQDQLVVVTSQQIVNISVVNLFNGLTGSLVLEDESITGDTFEYTYQINKKNGLYALKIEQSNGVFKSEKIQL